MCFITISISGIKQQWIPRLLGKRVMQLLRVRVCTTAFYSLPVEVRRIYIYRCDLLVRKGEYLECASGSSVFIILSVVLKDLIHLRALTKTFFGTTCSCCIPLMRHITHGIAYAPISELFVLPIALFYRCL